MLGVMGLELDSILKPRLEGAHYFGKRNGSRTCLVQTFGRAGTNLGRDDYDLR